MKRRDFENVQANVCLLCNGVKCKRCGKDAFVLNRKGCKKAPIYGLHCDWVGDGQEILACQRPSTRIIKEFKIVDQFKSKGILSVFNLQEPGEHPHCGDKINKISGFSYFPENFMDHGIFYFNFPWPDMTAPSLSIIHNCCQVMASQIARGGKIMVHCHAGLGRTGMMIACLLVYKDKLSADEAIAIVKRDRLGSIQRDSQMKAISDYEWFLKQSNVIYAAAPGDKTFTISEHLDRQNVYLSGSKADVMRWTPQVLHIAFTKLGKSIIERRLEIAHSFIAPLGDDMWIERELRLQDIKMSLHAGKLEDMEKEEDVSVIANLLLDWLEHLSEPLLPEKFVSEAATYLHSHKDACWILREEEKPETSEAEAREKGVAQEVLEKAALQNLRTENFRTLALIISFFRTLLLGKVESEDFTTRDVIMVPLYELRKICMRLAVALMHLNSACVKRAQPAQIAEVKDRTDIALDNISRLIGVDLASPRAALFGSKSTMKKGSVQQPSTPAPHLVRRNSQIVMTRFFLGDDLDKSNPAYQIYGYLIALFIQNWTTDRKETLEVWRLRRDSTNAEGLEPLEFLLQEINVQATSPRPSLVSPSDLSPAGSPIGSRDSKVIDGEDFPASEGKYLDEMKDEEEIMYSKSKSASEGNSGSTREGKAENPFRVENSPVVQKQPSKRYSESKDEENPFMVEASKVEKFPPLNQRKSLRLSAINNPFST